MIHFTSLTDKELKELAIGIYAGTIFTDRHVSESSDLGHVFMPIVFGAFSEATEEEIDKVGLIYEHINEAGSRSFNGLPMFFSMKIIRKEDAKKVFDYYGEYKKLRDDFTSTEKLEEHP